MMTVAATCYMASYLSGERAGSSVMASRHSYLHWLPLKAPSPTFKVMIVNNELYAQMMGVILKGRAFEVVRFDKEGLKRSTNSKKNNINDYNKASNHLYQTHPSGREMFPERPNIIT